MADRGFGTFLELGIPTGDIRKSLAFYRTLGFSEIAPGDVRTHYYAVVTDGHMAIGLHGGGLAEPALGFVRPGLASHARARADEGCEFEFMRLGSEEFHEVGLRTPDGQLIVMMEARTFPPGDEDEVPATRIGRSTHLALHAGDPAATRSFFERAGFLAADDESTGETLLTTVGLSLTLTPHQPGQRFVLHFAAADPARVVRELSDLGLVPQRNAAGAFLQAPEGTRLVLG